MSKKARANILLLITAVIWGFSFVAQKAGATLEPFTYNGIRVMIGGLALIPVSMIFSRINNGSTGGNTDGSTGGNTDGSAGGSTGALDTASNAATRDAAEERRTLIKGGLVCGIILCIASNLQQFGIYFETDAGKAGFITTLYIVIVPMLGVFLRKRVSLRMWFCVIVGAIGFFLLTIAGKGNGFTLEKGDFFVLLCAFVFSLHILAVDHFSPKCDGVKLSCLQFLVAGVISLTLMFIFESPKLPEIMDCWMPILYSGLCSSGIGYTLQILAQKDADPTTASLIMSLESVFAVLAGAMIFSERLTFIELMGCVVIFAAVIISQLPSKKPNDALL